MRVAVFHTGHACVLLENAHKIGCIVIAEAFADFVYSHLGGAQQLLCGFHALGIQILREGRSEILCNYTR